MYYGLCNKLLLEKISECTEIEKKISLEYLLKSINEMNHKYFSNNIPISDEIMNIGSEESNEFCRNLYLVLKANPIDIIIDIHINSESKDFKEYYNKKLRQYKIDNLINE